MTDSHNYAKVFEDALTGLLNNWRVWCGNDEIRALHIGFDSTNTEVSVSLLTDREPYLEDDEIEPLGARWPTADWRLTNINETSRHGFPDAAEVLEWMEENADELSDEELILFNQKLKKMFFEIATGRAVLEQLAAFRNSSKSIKIRVEWFFDNEPLDATITP